MARVVSATEARIHLGELMREAVETGEPIVVERGGQSHVVLLSVNEYQRLLSGQKQQEGWQALVGQARTHIEADLSGRELPQPAEILRQMREERDEQLLALR